MSERRDRDRELSPPPWPADEELPSAEELAAAEALAQATDRVLAGASPDDAGATPDRVVGLDAAEFDGLAATLGAIHASHHEAELPRARRDALFEEALREADGRQRGRARTRLVPLLALAATVLLAIGAVLVGLPRLASDDRASRRVAMSPETSVRQALPMEQRSRPSNDLIRRPIKDRGLHASRRLDRVFASRMAGYRALRYARWTGQPKAGRTP
ncbi:MAG: hypothetical protein CSA65_05720 [Proteobacteria bacterium]|nr:MAG: hypothetical protein CSB49_02050 [Pseudomonadota bacterium]PIE18215.1 MAG: hypothetical protein CSA65_05720 [Pseudomonadota bacterium]